MPRINALDGLRALAITGVIAAHSGVAHAQGARIGVYLFFSLSGYLIARLMLEEQAKTGRIDVTKFYARRALRLTPAMLLGVAGTATYAVVVDDDVTLRSTVPAALYYANWIWVAHGTGALGLFGHFWSLAVEEQFYLVWPGLLVVTARWRRRRLVALIGALAILAVLLRITFFGGSDSLGVTFSTPGIVDQLAGGALVALISTSSAIEQLRRDCPIFGVTDSRSVSWWCSVRGGRRR